MKDLKSKREKRVDLTRLLTTKYVKSNLKENEKKSLFPRQRFSFEM